MTSGHSYPRVSRQFKSVYTLQWKNMTNTSYACPLGSHVQQPYVKSLLSRNWAPFSGMKSWPPAIVRPDRRPGLLHALSNEPPQSWEGWFDKVVTGLLGLPGPINSICDQYKSKLVHRGQTDAVLKRHRWELPPWNLRIAMPSPHSSLLSDPLSLICPARSQQHTWT
jgi:hypothetical protein